MEDKIKTIAVIGSNSFTGSHLIEYFLKKTNYKVIGISRSKEYNPLFLSYLYKKVSRPKNFVFHRLDLNKEKDFEELIRLFDKEKPSLIFNYAAQGEVRNSWKYPEQWFKTNCLAVVKLANQLKDRDYIERYIAISTPEVYGSSNKKIKENNCYNPSTPYAASKLSGDLFLKTLYKRYNFPVIFIRSANVYGLHQQLYRIIPRSVIHLKLGEKIYLHGKGITKRSFIHVRDVVRITSELALKGKIGNSYNISKEKSLMSILELVKKICISLKKDFSKFVELVDEDFGQDNSYYLDSSKSFNLLKDAPKISLEEGIKETINWIEDNWEEIKKQKLDYIYKE